MMITIHGLPINVKYQDLKALIKRECKITDFILDHLVPEGNGNKKVRMGLANNNEGNHVIKCLNGYRLAGHILQVTPVGKSLDFQSQQQNTYSTSQPRVDPWNNESNQSQWSNSRQQQQDTYNYPSKVVNQQTRSQFDQKTSILGRIVPPSQGFSISPKNATAQAGTQARQGFLRTVEIIDTAQNTTQGHQNYDSSQDRPTIIMKDHFQGGQYIVTPQQSSGHYQERQSWGQQVASKSDLFTKNERISYGNRQDKGELIKDFVEETQKLHFQGRSHDVLPPARMDIHTQSRRFSPSNRPVSPTTRPISPSNRHMSPSGRRLSPSSRRMSPNGRRMSPSGSRISSSGRRLSQSARRTSPSGSRMSPSGRRLSPSARRMSPNSRRMSPSVRRESTSGRPVSPNARRVSPSGRRMLSSVRTSSSMYRPMSPSEKGVLTSFAPFSSSDRHVMQSGRQISPFGRSGMPNQSMKSIDSLSKPLSPSRRQISPERKMFLPERTMHGRHISSPIRKPTMSERNIPARRDDMRQMSPLNRSKPERYSPTRCFEDSRSVKQVRPAYDPASDSNQAMYSGAFRPNDSLQYSSKGREERPDSWSNRINEHNKAHVEERRDKVRMSKFEPARPIDHPREIDEVMKRSVSRNRESRSPRRDRSPLRDRFKRHSPSPRSPRRSWALEKRRSPEDADIPPPPSWPGQDHNRLLKDIRDKRDHFPQRVEESRGATWDMNKYEPIQDEGREIRTIADDRRPFERPVITVRKDLEKWKPIDNDSPKRSPPRYKPEENERALRRKDIESRFEDFRAQNERKACSDRREFEEPRRDEERRFKSDFTNAAELSKIKEELTRRIEKKTEILKKQEELQKEIEYVYKRATDFTKKAEYKKCDRRHDDYKEHRRLDDLDPKEFDLPTLTRLKEERRDRNLDRVESRKKEMDETLRSDVPNADGIRVKRHKAAEAIADKIFDKFGGMLPKDITKCVKNELKLFILKILKRIFGEEDVSFIEMIIKFNSKHSTKDEEDIYDSIMAGFPNQYRNLKRLAKDEPSEVPAKISKPSSVSQVDKDVGPTPNYQTPGWEYSCATQQVSQVSATAFMNTQYIVPFPTFFPTYGKVPQQLAFAPETDSLSLCKDDFQPINSYEADLIKDYIISKMVQVSHAGQPWSPEFTFKGLQSHFRFEVLTRDAASRNWLLNLDFNQLTNFNILVYTKEELWYERAAIWLPGHSKCRLEPLEKLKLQNKFLESINIGKWKLVKNIVTTRGTRVYVDMPPSSARALENHNMTLSYELQKVNVFLKAMAVDNDAFDAGLKEQSINTTAAPQDPMPSLPNDSKAIKFCVKGDKPVTLGIARKIKESIIYHLFKYHQSGGSSRTDFIKYGFMTSGYFGVQPENDESKRWLKSVGLGFINKQPITVFGAEDYRTRFVKMFIVWPGEQIVNSSLAFEKLRISNQGVKGIYFNKWKRIKLYYDHTARKSTYEIEMDLDSVERIARLKFQLDYVVDGVEKVVYVQSQYPESKLTEIIKTYKEENSDKYDVANMELSSGSETNDDLVCLDD